MSYCNSNFKFPLIESPGVLLEGVFIFQRYLRGGALLEGVVILEGIRYYVFLKDNFHFFFNQN